MHVHDLLELWIHISIPLHRKADKERRKPFIEKARALLAELSKSNYTIVTVVEGVISPLQWWEVVVN